MSTIASNKMESPTPTPWAVRCRGAYCAGIPLVFLTRECYDWQMNTPDALWRCPRCGGLAEWADDNYEKHYPDEPDGPGALD